MRNKFLIIPIFIGLIISGCASPPKKERVTLPSQRIEAQKIETPKEERLKEIVVPQKEEQKKIPEKLYSFYARDLNVQDILLAFSKETDYNIIMDPELSGKVTIDLKRVTLKEALDAILSPLGWTYRIEDKFIKIMRPQMETRIFTLNYLSTRRTGKREIYASTGGGLQTPVIPGQQVSTTVPGGRTGYSDLVSVDEMDL